MVPKRGSLMLPSVLKWTLVAASVGGCTSGTSSTGAPKQLTCAYVDGGSVQTFIVDASTCPDGSAEEVTA
jgi:hypothetical protein